MSYVERSNLSMRMGMRRFMRLTNAFSKKIENHLHALSLYLHYNFVRVHKTLRVTPTMAAGITNTLHDMEWIVGLIDARGAGAEQTKPQARNGPTAQKVKVRHYGTTGPRASSRYHSCVRRSGVLSATRRPDRGSCRP